MGTKKIVMTIADDFNHSRQHVIDRLKQAGATNVKLLCLTIAERKKSEEFYHRSIRQAEAAGMKLGDYMNKICKDEENKWNVAAKGEPTMEEFIDWLDQIGANKRPWEDPTSIIDGAIVLDVTSRDETVMKDIDDALGLTRSVEEHGTYEEIVEKVRQRDFQRDEETPMNMELFAECNKAIEEGMKLAKKGEEGKKVVAS